ncbi:MAG: prephenate dehydratase [Micavibrio aeruginosavorus]|uniref:prephenate dehydratase n=1 Tax=Micavibrio aeruginosavorus TaxID=349221 RepID=A0A2W5A1U1_9BACT|nr:MAG: prephenate dehydratase [Micavibrio aeruginosavorus]
MSKENKKKISFQGAHGAYSDIACREVFPGLETIPCNTFEEAFAACQNGDADLAMIPVDNTLAGRVADVHHFLPRSGLSIVGEHFLKIEHALLGVKGATIEGLKHVHSHLHALPQCRKVIKELGLTPHVHADTAGAASEVADRGDMEHAAIASKLAAEIYGLEILRGDVQDADHNATRFIILSRTPSAPAYEADKTYITSFTFTVRNIPAALYKAMGGFATNGVNMVKLESYMNPQFQSSSFYADVVDHADSEALKRAFAELEFFAEELNVLGSYPAHPFRKL